MFAIEVSGVFSAAHQLRLPGGGVEPLHGHDWRITARVEAEGLDALETVIDFHVLEGALQQICAAWNNRNLNEVEPFVAARNPSAERVAERIAELLRPAVTAAGDQGRARLMEVRVTEAPGCVAIWREQAG